jgi:hypothetical protein
MPGVDQKTENPHTPMYSIVDPIAWDQREGIQIRRVFRWEGIQITDLPLLLCM